MNPLPHLAFLTSLTLLSSIQCIQGDPLIWSNQPELLENLLLPENLERRSLSSSTTSTQPLAVKDNRIDPLHHLHKYKGGYDIENKHYWASTVFTGIYGYAIAAIWLLAGVIFGLCACVASCCCHSRRKKSADNLFQQPAPSSNLCCSSTMIVLILLTILIVIGSGILLVSDRLLHSNAKRVERTIIDAANSATITIYNVTSTMSEMETELQPYDASITDFLKSTIEDLDKDASQLNHKVDDNKSKIDTAIKLIYIIISVIGSFNLAFAILGLVYIILSRTRVSILLMMIVLCWVLIVVDWVGFGFYFAINNFVDDTCLALKEYVQNPSNTTLDSILPCGDLRSASEQVTEARQRLHELIVQANMNITTLREEEATNGVAVGRLIPFICNPFSGSPNYEYTGNCSDGSVSVGQIPGMLQAFKCSNNDASAQTCVDESVYETIVAYSSAAQNLIDIIPGLESLTNCSFVVDTFSVIVRQQCRPLKRAASLLWITMAVVSSLMIFLITTWVTKFMQKRKASQDRHFRRTSIMPHDTPSPSRAD